MRDIALAQSWHDRGGKATFLSYCESDMLRRRIMDDGFGFVSIDRLESVTADLDATLKVIRDRSCRDILHDVWLVADGYKFDCDYHRSIREEGVRLLIVDDNNYLPRYHADILLNPNIFAPQMNYLCDEGTIKLLGCRYALLRKEFQRYNDSEKEITKNPGRILVTLGGADPKNTTLSVIDALCNFQDKDFDVRIVAGPVNPNIKSLKEKLSRSPFSYRLLPSVTDMPKLMSWADIAISAASGTFWELAFMGIPTLIITLADNQIGIGETLEDMGAAIHLGWYENVEIEGMVSEISRIIKDYKLRKRLSEKARDLIDGRGAYRVVSGMAEWE